ncbi:MAG: transcriptional regulator [Anaerolineae bacterium UTCFX1]|jgi:transcriptional regulator with XRE-family HTH domain|nr:MAG: transcriptional regulator [Anaerolineae bacterium UTCFX1]
MDILKRFGQKVRKLRIEQGLSQEKLAELAGIHRTYISSLELGKRNVSLVNIQALAKALRVSPDELLK